ncbi:MAG: hypothetical protein Q9223_004846 [Gallowayella weberi]
MPTRRSQKAVASIPRGRQILRQHESTPDVQQMGDHASSPWFSVEFMGENDPLSKALMESKRRRRSAGDIQPFETHLNQLFSKKIDARIGHLGRPEGRFTFAGKNLTVAASLIQRQRTDLGIKLRTRSFALPHIRSLSERQDIRPTIKMLASGALEALCDVARDVTSMLLILGKLLAMAYTFTSTTFLSSFCQHEVPLLRDRICGARDRRLAEHEIVVENLNRPFQNILESGQKTASYSLPWLLSDYEVTVRKFRAYLPETEYTKEDKEFFRGKFAKFIGGCKSTIDIAQQFHSHVTSTINTHVSDTEYVVLKLQKYGFLASSKPARLLNGMLAQAMAWLNSYNLVYLPVGIEPFQRNSLRRANVQAIRIMEGHVELMIHRLDEDIRLVNLLQRGIWNLGNTAGQIMEQIPRCRQTNEHDGSRLSKVKESIWGQSIEGYQIEKRGLWLGKMGLQFEETVEFLTTSGYQLSNARSTMLALIERLGVEGRAAKYGWEVDEWVREQAKELKKGFQDLVEQLKAFKSETMRFDDRVFKSVTGREVER